MLGNVVAKVAPNMEEPLGHHDHACKRPLHGLPKPPTKFQNLVTSQGLNGLTCPVLSALMTVQ